MLTGVYAAFQRVMCTEARVSLNVLFVFLRLLREYWQKDILAGQLAHLCLESTLEDFVFLCTLLGNDVLPRKLPDIFFTVLRLVKVCNCILQISANLHITCAWELIQLSAACDLFMKISGIILDCVSCIVAFFSFSFSPVSPMSITLFSWMFLVGMSWSTSQKPYKGQI